MLSGISRKENAKQEDLTYLCHTEYRRRKSTAAKGGAQNTLIPCLERRMEGEEENGELWGNRHQGSGHTVDM